MVSHEITELARRIVLGDVDAVPLLVSAAVRSGVMLPSGNVTWYVRRVRDGRWYGPGRDRWVERIDDARVYKTENMANIGASRVAHEVTGGDMEVVCVVPLQLGAVLISSRPSHYGPNAPGWRMRLRAFLDEAGAEIDDMERDRTLSEQDVRNRLWRIVRRMPEEERPRSIALNGQNQVVFDDWFADRVAEAYAVLDD